MAVAISSGDSTPGGGCLEKWWFFGRMRLMSKKSIAFVALFVFMAVLFAAPLAEAVLTPSASHSHHNSAEHDGCPMPAPADQVPTNGHGGFTSCCGVSFMSFGVENNPFGIFFASTLIFFSYTLFIPSRITAELFRPPKY